MLNLLNSFSSVQDYLSWFAVPQAILSSLISENNSLVPLDQSRNTPWKGWCTGCLPDLSLWSGAGSIRSNCACSFPAYGASLVPRGVMLISTSCRRSKGSVSSPAAAAAAEPAMWVPAKGGGAAAAVLWQTDKYLPLIWQPVRHTPTGSEEKVFKTTKSAILRSDLNSIKGV